MAGIRFLLDENVPVQLARALRRAQPGIEVRCIGERDAPAHGTSDPDILRRIEQYRWVLVSRNRRTLPGHLVDLLGGGLHVPGILLITEAATWAQVIENLLSVSSSMDAEMLRDQIRYVPV